MGAHSETQYYKSFVDCLQPIENNPKIQRMKNTNTNKRYKQIKYSKLSKYEYKYKEWKIQILTQGTNKYNKISKYEYKCKYKVK